MQSLTAFAKLSLRNTILGFIGALIPLAATPIVTRLYTPANFGEFTYFTTILLFSSRGCSLGVQTYIFSSRLEDKEKRELVGLILTVSTYLFPVFVFVYACAAATQLKFNQNLSIAYGAIVALTGLLSNSIEVIRSIFIDKRQSTFLSRSNAVGNIAGSVLRIGFGYTSLGTLGLLLSSLGAVGTETLLLVKLKVAKAYELFIGNILSPKKFLRVFTQYNYQIYNSLPQVLLDALFENITIIYILGKYDAQLTGQYSVIMRILLMLSSILSSSLSVSFASQFRDIFQNGSSSGKKSIYRIYYLTMLALSSVTLIAVPVAPSVVGIALGSNWNVAATISPYLLIWCFSRTLSSSFSLLPHCLNLPALSRNLTFGYHGITIFLLLVLLPCKLEFDQFIATYYTLLALSLVTISYLNVNFSLNHASKTF